MPRHVHADLIKAWAEGAVIQFKGDDGRWRHVEPTWNPNYEYRIAPKTIKREGWINIYPSNTYMAHAGPVYASHKEAMAVCEIIAGCATIKIEWEEEQ